MDLRTVIQNKKSLYVCIPQESAENLNVKKGDRCEIILLPGYGVLVRKEGNGSKYPIPQEAEYQAQRAAREAYEEAKRKINVAIARELEKTGIVLACKLVGKLGGPVVDVLKMIREKLEEFEAEQKRLMAESMPEKKKEKSGATLIKKLRGRTKPKRAEARG